MCRMREAVRACPLPARVLTSHTRRRKAAAIGEDALSAMSTHHKGSLALLEEELGSTLRAVALKRAALESFTSEAKSFQTSHGEQARKLHPLLTCTEADAIQCSPVTLDGITTTYGLVVEPGAVEDEFLAGWKKNVSRSLAKLEANMRQADDLMALVRGLCPLCGDVTRFTSLKAG